MQLRGNGLVVAIPVQDGEHIMEGGVRWERESPEEKVWLFHALFLAVAVCGWSCSVGWFG